MTKPIIELIEQSDNHKVYYMHQDISGLGIYERTKAIERFVNNATKTLETLISSDLRDFLRVRGIIIQDGSNQALERAFLELESKGYSIAIIDRYYQIGDERIISESPNQMTIIQEDDDLIGCSMEIRVEEIEDEKIY